MSTSDHSPSPYKTAFSCPHCGAFTTQYWYTLYAKSLPENKRTPFFPRKDVEERIKSDTGMTDEDKKTWLELFKKMRTGLVYFDEKSGSVYPDYEVGNLFLSRCYNCRKVAVWVHEKLLFPPQRMGPEPNADLSEDIKKDLEEARSIINLSPRGAAALLRLCVQKLCKELGGTGRDINSDIANLVAKGLNPLVQQSLDVVRVVGNESVHPGMIDLKDDSETALHLIGLINSIAEQMITHPKNVQRLYGALPETKRRAIEERNEKALKRE